jgi:hypothetical protein
MTPQDVVPVSWHQTANIKLQLNQVTTQQFINKWNTIMKCQAISDLSTGLVWIFQHIRAPAWEKKFVVFFGEFLPPLPHSHTQKKILVWGEDFLDWISDPIETLATVDGFDSGYSAVVAVTVVKIDWWKCLPPPLTHTHTHTHHPAHTPHTKFPTWTKAGRGEFFEVET